MWYRTRHAAAVVLALLGMLGDSHTRMACGGSEPKSDPSCGHVGQAARTSGLWPAVTVHAQPCAAAILRLRGGSLNQFGMSPQHGSPQPAQSPAANNADLLGQLSKETLQAELERRGCDSVGAKSVLAIRLNRVMSEDSGQGGAQKVHGGESNAGGLLQAQEAGHRTGEVDMMDVDAAGKSAAPPPVTPARTPGGMRRMDDRGKRRIGYNEQRGRRGSQRGSARGRDRERSFEGLKSGNLKVSTPAKNAAYRNTRVSVQEGGKRGPK